MVTRCGFPWYPVIVFLPPVLDRRFSGPLNQEPLPVRLSCEFEAGVSEGFESLCASTTDTFQ